MVRFFVGATGTVSLSGLLLVGSATTVLAQLSTTPPPQELPEIVVEAEGTKKKKAPAAAQQSSTPRKSPATTAGSDTSDVAASPTSIASPVEQIASSVTVITAKEIEAKQYRTVPDALKTVPGLNVVAIGGPGGQTSVFMRGTNSNHTKVVIDGIEISDPSNPNRSADLGQLLTADIERIEVLRGPQSGLYGSEAIGGVIAIYTKKGKGPAQVNAMVEGGSFGTFNQAVGARGSAGKLNYSFNVSHFRANDIPVTPHDLVPPGQQRFGNSYDNWTYSAKLGYDFTKDFSLNTVVRYTDATLHYTGDDPFGFPSFPNPFQSQTDVEQLFTRTEAVWRTFGGLLTNYFGVNYTDIKNDQSPIAAGFPETFNDGDRLKFDWRGVVTLAPEYVVVTGLEHQEESIDTLSPWSGPFAGDEWTRAAYVELQSEPIHNFFVVANVRVDENETFGDVTTWRVAPAYLIEGTGTKLKASYGTGFKVPTLFQRFSGTSANPDLRPEESEGFDVGFEQAIGTRVQFGATYFDNDLTNLIVSGPGPTFQNLNVGRARTEGVEVFASADITDELRVRADYTYTEARNEITHEDLLRRPRNKASLSVGWTPVSPLLLSTTVLYVGETADIDRSVFSTVTLPSFTLVNIAADYKLNDNMSLFGRVDNLFDRKYENPDGFEQTGIGAYVGIRFNN